MTLTCVNVSLCNLISRFKDLCSAMSCLFLSWTNESSSSMVVIGPLCTFLQADMQIKILLLCVNFIESSSLTSTSIKACCAFVKDCSFSFNSLDFCLFALVLHIYPLSIKSLEYFIIRSSEVFLKPCGPVFLSSQSRFPNKFSIGFVWVASGSSSISSVMFFAMKSELFISPPNPY